MPVVCVNDWGSNDGADGAYINVCPQWSLHVRAHYQVSAWMTYCGRLWLLLYVRVCFVTVCIKREMHTWQCITGASFPIYPCSQRSLVLGLNQLPFFFNVTSVQLWSHLSFRCEFYHPIMLGCINWQLWLLPGEDFWNPVSQDTSWIPLTLYSGERWTQFKHNLDVLVVASAKPYSSLQSATIPPCGHNPTSYGFDLQPTLSSLTSVLLRAAVLSTYA